MITPLISRTALFLSLPFIVFTHSISPDGNVYSPSPIPSHITSDGQSIQPNSCTTKMCYGDGGISAIPVRLFAKGSGKTKIERSAFPVKVPGETAWRENRGQAWMITRDYGGHGTHWKLVNPKGNRVASLTADYSIRIRNASIY